MLTSTRCLSGIRQLARDLSRPFNLLKLTFCIPASYYAYQVGYFIGSISRTPELASALSDPRVWCESITPQDLRWYAWLALWGSGAVLLHAAWTFCDCTADDVTGQAGPETAVSPKLPYNAAYKSLAYPPSQQLPQAGATEQSLRSTAFARALYTIPVFMLVFAFIKKQHVGSTLVYHPVTSPVLLQHSTDLAEIARLETLGPATASTLAGFSTAPDRQHAWPIVLSRNENSVPNVVHFVFGMDATFGGKPFGFAHYLSIYSGERALPSSRV